MSGSMMEALLQNGVCSAIPEYTRSSSDNGNMSVSQQQVPFVLLFCFQFYLGQRLCA